MSDPASQIDEVSSLLPNEADSDDDEPLGTRLIVGIGFTWFASFLAALDITITSTISATVANEFGSLAVISWLASAYLIALTATQPLSGKLTDIFGRRSGYILSVALFAVGNGVCGIAQTIPVVIVGRILAGIGGGGCNSIGTFIQNDLIPVRSRGFWNGVGNVVYAVGLGLGGVVGGGITQSLGWRWAFIILMPSSFISAAGVVIFLPPLTSSDVGSRVKRVDFLGAFLLVTSFTSFLIGLNNEGQDPLVLKITLPVGASLFVAFALVEAYYAAEPIIPLRLMKSRTLTLTCVSAWFYCMAFYTMMFYVPLYFQLRGFSTAETGALLIGEPVGGALSSFACGLIMRVRGKYGLPKVATLVIFLGGPGGFLLSTLDTPVWLAEVAWFLNGVGFGGLLTVLMIVVLSDIDQEDQAVATSVYYAFRTTGGTIGVAAASTLFRALVGKGEHDQLGRLLSHLNSAKTGHELPWDDKEVFLYALRGTFGMAVALGVAGLICGLFTKNYELSDKPLKRTRR